MPGLVKFILSGVLFSLFSLPLSSEAGTRLYIRVAPPVAKIKVVRPARRHKHNVWVAGHYRHHGNRYVWVKGHHIHPRGGFSYIQPRWKKTHHGYYFVPGHWVKK